ncbi:TrbC/VirB2 family protein [Wolbachia endosymbiont of Ctenocephalides felis wCfeT]|uniref:TrbC/VirB2 family protein n=1 Tax=Wolbachia endosymbiont of Ctenocephalides felis wCfeT TaxID=2732593 RepID=UPI0014467CD7|nr:TrbC/VirB2 family protein [Wolbachia endosymbiont of Ctenocephalides felis wCfeT]
MNSSIKKILSIFFIILLITFPHIGSSANGSGNTGNTGNQGNTIAQIICNVISYIHGIGVPLITVTMIVMVLLMMFGKMAWPALVAFMLCTGVFFSAATLISKLAPGMSTISCCPAGQTYNLADGVCK